MMPYSNQELAIAFFVSLVCAVIVAGIVIGLVSLIERIRNPEEKDIGDDVDG